MSEISNRDAAHNAATLVRLGAQLDAVFTKATDLAFASVVHGSPLTGAPGQPVAPAGVPNAGELRDSWTLDRSTPKTAVIGTAVDYAEDVEEALHGQHFHSGGPHSVALTAANFDRVLDAAVREVAR